MAQDRDDSQAGITLKDSRRDNARADIIFLDGTRGRSHAEQFHGNAPQPRRMNNNGGAITNSVLNLGRPIRP